jgi:hypothetical protein
MISIPRQGVDPVAHAYRRTHPVEVGKITYGDIDFQTGDMDVTRKDSEKATFFCSLKSCGLMVSEVVENPSGAWSTAIRSRKRKRPKCAVQGQTTGEVEDRALARALPLCRPGSCGDARLIDRINPRSQLILHFPTLGRSHLATLAAVARSQCPVFRSLRSAPGADFNTLPSRKTSPAKWVRGSSCRSERFSNHRTFHNYDPWIVIMSLKTTSMVQPCSSPSNPPRISELLPCTTAKQTWML